MVETAQKNSRVQLAAILLIASVSLAAAYVLYYLARDGGVWATTNHGEFVQPPVTLADLGVVDDQGNSLLTGANWWLWVVISKQCGAECKTAVHRLRQLHVLLNKDASRIRRALVTPRALAPPAILEDYPNMRHLGLTGGLEDGIYIVDPLGNLVFFYPYADAGRPLLDDIKRLLKISQIG